MTPEPMSDREADEMADDKELQKEERMLNKEGKLHPFLDKDFFNL